ncbi:MAG: hypothetical protein ACRC6T_06100 [Sarcina sp.]
MLFDKTFDTDVLVSNEIYWYRNIKGVLFSNKLSVEEGRLIGEKIANFFMKYEDYKFKKVNLWQESKENLFLLLEMGFMTLKLYKNREFSTLLVDKEERVIIMINEENHITLLLRGINKGCRELYNEGIKFTSGIDEEFEIARSERFGYLNSTIDKVGTGMKLYSVLHLPLLNNIKMIKNVTSELDKVGIDFYDLFTDENEDVSNLYRISNRVTLDVTEEESLNDLEAMTYQVLIKEKKERKYLKETDYEGLCDNVFRAQALLSSARKITYTEALKLSSMIRLGIELDIIKDTLIATLNYLLLITKYNHIKSLADEKINENQENILRATRIREIIEKYKV